MFLTHRKPQMKMRWVHCARVERPSILRLAVKYQLHPLPAGYSSLGLHIMAEVEDTIQLEQQSVPIVASLVVESSKSLRCGSTTRTSSS